MVSQESMTARSSNISSTRRRLNGTRTLYRSKGGSEDFNCVNLHPDAADLLDWGTDMARPLRHATPGELAGVQFAKGSMGPKVRAACDFVNETGKHAGIGTLKDARAILQGTAGTVMSINPARQGGQALRQARMPPRHNSQR